MLDSLRIPPCLGHGSPSWREPEGEGGEGFYMAQTDRPADLLLYWRTGRLEKYGAFAQFPSCRATEDVQSMI
jgi:hypothetical protein